MKVARPVLANIIAERTLKKGLSKRLSREIAAYLLSERRVNELDSLTRDVQAVWASDGYVEVVASSAFPLARGVKADITKQAKRLYPSAKRIIISERPDPEVIAGVRLNLPNQQLDLTAESKLNRFKQLTALGKD